MLGLERTTMMKTVWSKNEKNCEIFVFAPLKFSDFQKFAKVAKLR